MRVLLTGGAGYIGSHIAVVLLSEGHDVVVLDDFSNSQPEMVRRVEELAGRPVVSIDCDLADFEQSSRALADIDFDSVIHLAGLKSIGESVRHPSSYYRTNILATLNILDIMAVKDVQRFVFSSSATVYGVPEQASIDETHPVGRGLTNPYGWSKWMNEQVIRDVQNARPKLRVSLLRYFNPVGAHPSGRIGESPSGVPNNLMPYVAQVAAGTRDHVSVFGDDYETSDGTGVRDYIHIMDLAEGHLAALAHQSPGVSTYNLGTGIGHSVLELIREFAAQSGREIPFRIAAPRPGDVSAAIADPAKANAELGWRATRSLADSCRDSWRWQSRNPHGLIAAR